jgi:hypothetical protein
MDDELQELVDFGLELVLGYETALRGVTRVWIAWISSGK